MDESSKKKLWAAYAAAKTAETKEKIILEYAPLVKLVAGRLSMYLGYNVEYEDLVSYGIFGLIDAIDKFDCTKDVKFETYASLRIRGAILDQIRKMDWIPRTLRQKQKKIETACHKIEEVYGRTATNKEIAEELEITIDELDTWQNQTKLTSLVSLDEFLEQGAEIRMGSNTSIQFEQPERVMEKQQLKEVLVATLETLTENERKVIVLYYYEELTLKEISKVLAVSESRISQLHTKALQKMKRKLGNNMDVFESY